MNVYIICNDDSEVEKVFSNEASAQDWVIDNKLGWMDGSQKNEKEEEALHYIEEHQVND